MVIELGLAAVLSSLDKVASSNTATMIFDKVEQAKTNKDKDKAIQQLEEIINDLNSDKTELIKISNSLESELVAKKISEDEIEFISEEIIPVLEQLLSANASNPAEKKKVDDLVDTIRPLLAKETFMILQSLGFNFKEAIGEPLTELIRTLITAKIPQKNQGKQKDPRR